MNRIKLAVADDHPLFRKGLVGILSNMNEVDVILEADNGKQLINGFDNHSPDISVLDIKMPEMNGIETAKYIRKKYPNQKIIMLSMYNDDQFIISLLKLGVNGFVLKDTNPQELEEAIHSVATKGFYASSFVFDTMRNHLEDFSYTSSNTKKNSLKKNAQLSAREQEVLRLICKEYTSTEIAKIMDLSVRTIEGYRKKLLEKIGARNTVGLVFYALNHNLAKLN